MRVSHCCCLQPENTIKRLWASHRLIFSFWSSSAGPTEVTEKGSNEEG